MQNNFRIVKVAFAQPATTFQVFKDGKWTITLCIRSFKSAQYSFINPRNS